MTNAEKLQLALETMALTIGLASVIVLIISFLALNL